MQLIDVSLARSNRGLVKDAQRVLYAQLRASLESGCYSGTSLYKDIIIWVDPFLNLLSGVCDGMWPDCRMTSFLNLVKDAKYGFSKYRSGKEEALWAPVTIVGDAYIMLLASREAPPPTLRSKVSQTQYIHIYCRNDSAHMELSMSSIWVSHRVQRFSPNKSSAVPLRAELLPGA